jgi:hypothetical protein
MAADPAAVNFPHLDIQVDEQRAAMPLSNSTLIVKEP